MRILVVACLATLLAAPAGADAPTFVCKDQRIEKGQSTWGYARPRGEDVRLETTTQTVGYVIDRGSRFAIESAGQSTLGWLAGERIEHPNGATWEGIDAARRFAACPDPVAAGLWVLAQNGKI